MTRILVPYHLDELLPDLDAPFEADETVTVDLPDDDVWGRMSAVHDAVADAVARAAAFPSAGTLVMTGDCTASAGVLAGLQRRGVDPAIVWFDAHGDVQTLETTASGYLGGIALRFLVGYRPELVADRLGLRPVAEDRVVLVDARELDPPERDYLATAAIRHETVTELEPPDGPIYLHIDLDVLDPSLATANQWTPPGGITVEALIKGVAAARRTAKIGALGVGSYDPGCDQDGRALEAAVAAVQALLT